MPQIKKKKSYRFTVCKHLFFNYYYYYRLYSLNQAKLVKWDLTIFDSCFSDFKFQQA